MLSLGMSLDKGSQVNRRMIINMGGLLVRDVHGSSIFKSSGKHRTLDVLGF